MSETINNQVNNKKINLYFTNQNNSKILQETREIFAEKDDNLAAILINELLKGPVSSDLKNVIPKETQLLGVKTEDSLVTVNFSKEYYNTDSVGEIIARHSVGSTLFGLPNIEEVQILVEGQELMRLNGKSFGILKRDDLVLDTSSGNKDKMLLKLYFSGENAEGLIAEYRIINAEEDKLIEKSILCELIKGPQSRGLFATIPPETKVISVETTNEGVCFVNLSQEFKTKHNGGSTGEILTIYSIVNSLAELPNVKEVQFLIDGQKVEVFKHMIFNEPFLRDTTIIKK
jgi:germination protein M